MPFPFSSVLNLASQMVPPLHNNIKQPVLCIGTVYAHMQQHRQPHSVPVISVERGAGAEAVGRHVAAELGVLRRLSPELYCSLQQQLDLVSSTMQRVTSSELNGSWPDKCLWCLGWGLLLCGRLCPPSILQLCLSGSESYSSRE